MPAPKPKAWGEKPRSLFMVSAAMEMLARSRKLTTYISIITGIRCHAARDRMRSDSIRRLSEIISDFSFKAARQQRQGEAPQHRHAGPHQKSRRIAARQLQQQTHQARPDKAAEIADAVNQREGARRRRAAQ